MNYFSDIRQQAAKNHDGRKKENEGSKLYLPQLTAWELQEFPGCSKKVAKTQLTDNNSKCKCSKYQLKDKDCHIG